MKAWDTDVRSMRSCDVDFRKQSFKGFVIG